MKEHDLFIPLMLSQLSFGLAAPVYPTYSQSCWWGISGMVVAFHSYYRLGVSPSLYKHIFIILLQSFLWKYNPFPPRTLTDTDLYLLNQNFPHPLTCPCYPNFLNSGGLRNKVKKPRRKPCRYPRQEREAAGHMCSIPTLDFPYALIPGWRWGEVLTLSKV